MSLMLNNKCLTAHLPGSTLPNKSQKVPENS